MAEKNNYYGSGIFVAGNIDIGAIGKPADSRVMVPNLEGLAELVAAKRVYDGMIVYCESTKTYHKCSVEWDSSMNITSSSWKEVEILSEDELKALIAQETTAAMEFKGTIANGVLPTAGNKGDLYKVVTKDVTIPADKNAEAEAIVVAKPGDSIVCEVVRVDDADVIKWYLIPSGDDDEDTWRAIKVNGVEKLGSGTTTGAVDFVGGANVTVSEAGGVITIAAEDTHYESKLVVGDSKDDGSDGNAENDYVHLNLVENGEVKSSHKIVGAGGITVTHAKAEGEDGVNVITIEAAKYDLAAKIETTGDNKDKAYLSLAGTDNSEDKVYVVGEDAVAVTVEDGKIKISAHDTKYYGSEGAEITVIATDDGEITADLTKAVRDKLDKVWEEAGAAAGVKSELQVEIDKKVAKEDYDAEKATFAIAETVNAALDLKANAADVVANTTFEEFKTANTAAIGEARTGAVSDVEAKGYAVATEVAETYATKTELGDVDKKFENYVTAASYAEDKAAIEKSIEDEVKALDDVDKAFETRIGALEGKFGTGEGTVEAQIATAIQGVQSQIDALDDTYATDAELKEVKEALEAEAAKHALKTDVKATTDALAKSISDETAARTEAVGAINTAIGEMEEAYKTADVAVLSEVQKQLDTKADKSVVDVMYTNAQIDDLVQGAKDYADANDANTAHTHAAGDGLKLGNVKGGIEGEVKYELNLAFGKLTEDNKLQLLDATNNAVIAEFDAAEFVEDSYLDNVTYKDENGDNILEFTFTLNDGSTKTVDVDLSHLVDIYLADETSLTLAVSGNGKVFKVKEGGIETKHIKDGNVTEAKLEKNVTDALALARTALQSHQDISGKADRVTGAVAGNFAGLDANGNLVDSGKKAADFVLDADLYEWAKDEQIYHETDVVTSTSAGETEYQWYFVHGGDFYHDLLVELNDEKYLYGEYGSGILNGSSTITSGYWYREKAGTLYWAHEQATKGEKVLIDASEYTILTREEGQARIAQGGNLVVVNKNEVTATVISAPKTYTGNAFTSVEWDTTINEGAGGLRFVKGTQFATKAELDAALEAFGGDLSAITDNNTKYTFEIPTTGENAGKLVVTEVNWVNGVAEGSGTATAYDFATHDELAEIIAEIIGDLEELPGGAGDTIVEAINYLYGQIQILDQEIAEEMVKEVVPGTGLKVTTTAYANDKSDFNGRGLTKTIEIDEDVVFVLDCNW